MQRLTVTHRTEYRYAVPVAPGEHRLMLRPRETRELQLVSFDLHVHPTAIVTWAQDVAGNSVATASFAGLTDILTIESRMVVDLHAPVWPIFDIAASAQNYPFQYSDDDLTDLGALARPQYVDHADRLSVWSASFVMQRPTNTLSLLKDVANGIFNQINYQSREVEGTQGPLETLDRGWGSCRDIAVLFAEAARTLGFGARIVSGYLYVAASDVIGAPDAGATHAWVEVFVPGAGWIAFDPTNRAVGSANLIAVAAARHITQVAPVSGSFHGRPGDLLGMNVNVVVAMMQ